MIKTSEDFGGVKLKDCQQMHYCIQQDVKCKTLISPRPPECPICRNDPKLWPPGGRQRRASPLGKSKDHRRRSKQGFSDIWNFNKWTPRPCRCWMFDTQILWSPVKYTRQPVDAGEECAEAGTTFQQQGQATCQNSWEKNGAHYRKIPHKTYISLEGRKYALNMCRQ